MQKIDLTKQQRNLSQVVDNIEAEMAEQTIETCRTNVSYEGFAKR